MPRSFADVYLADEWMWNGISRRTGRPGDAKPPRPQRRQGIDLVEPFIGFNQSWSDTIDDLVDEELKRGQTIQRLFMMGHGEAGRFTVGETLTHQDDRTIDQFRRLRPFTQEGFTHAYIVGCGAAAEGPCIFGPLRHRDEKGAWRTDRVCLGPFTGNTKGAGYQLLYKLAVALRAPVTGSPWALAITDGWKMGGAHLTVGPSGGWTYSAIGYQGPPFGSP